MREDRAMMNLPRRSRRNLFATTALAAAMVHAPVGAYTGNLPTGGVVVGGTVAITPGSPSGTGLGTIASPFVTATTDAALGLQVTGPTAVVNWDQFQIRGSATSLTFSNANAAQAYSVLNRVNGGGDPTVIAGTLTALAAGKATIAVINEAGISVSGGQVVNLAGFVASTLNVDPTEFMANPNALHFVGTGAAALSVTGGSNITTSGPVILVAPQISSNGNITAGTSSVPADVALVVAADATVQLSGNSIIGVSIKKGSTLGTNSLSIGGAVSGGNVYAVAVTSADVTGTLLSISNALTATAANGRVVLSAGVVAPAGGSLTNGVTFDPTLTPHGGDVLIGTSGAFLTSGTVEIHATKDIKTADSFNAALTLTSLDAGHDINLNTGTKALAVTGTVTAGHDYLLTGDTVTLGPVAGGAAVTQSAQGQVIIQATGSGGIAVPGPVTLTANSDGDAAAEPMILDSAGAINAPALNLVGGISGVAGKFASPVGIRLSSAATTAAATDAIKLGNITASLLQGVDYVTTPSPGYVTTATDLTTSGAISLGTVTTAAPLTVKSNGTAPLASDVSVVAANSTGTTGAVDIESQFGAVTLGGATSSVGDVKVVAASTATVSGPVTSARDYNVTGGTVSLGGSAGVIQKAAGDITITASGAGGIATLGGLDALTLNAGTDAAAHTLTLSSGGNIAGKPRLIGGVSGSLCTSWQRGRDAHIAAGWRSISAPSMPRA